MIAGHHASCFFVLLRVSESSNVFETGVMSVFDDKILLLDPIALPIENISVIQWVPA